jgi:hypothetical protein
MIRDPIGIWLVRKLQIFLRETLDAMMIATAGSMLIKMQRNVNRNFMWNGSLNLDQSRDLIDVS